MNLMAAVYEATETIIDVQSQITNNILTNHTPPGPICSEFIFWKLIDRCPISHSGIFGNAFVNKLSPRLGPIYDGSYQGRNL